MQQGADGVLGQIGGEGLADCLGCKIWRNKARWKN